MGPPFLAVNPQPCSILWVPLCAIMAVGDGNAATGNPAHELLLTKSAAEQAAMLGKAVGLHWDDPVFYGHSGKWFCLLERSLRQWKQLYRARQPGCRGDRDGSGVLAAENDAP
jgi:hypothetical protein